MRILNSTAFWGILIASVFILAMSMQPSYADISPPKKADRCENLSGMQPPGSRGNTWRYRVKTPEKGDCRFR